MDARPMAPKEIAAHSGHHVKTVLTALRRGDLVGYQRAAGCSWRAYPEDVDRWIRGERPAKTRKAA
jgi:hypothetical protein